MRARAQALTPYPTSYQTEKGAHTMETTIKALKQGDFFTKKPIENPRENQVFIRGNYDRSTRKYEIGRFDDANYSALMKGTTRVYTDLVF